MPALAIWGWPTRAGSGRAGRRPGRAGGPGGLGRPGARGSGGIWRGAGTLLRNPAFAAYALQSSFAIAVFFSFIAGAPYFMIGVLGRSATE